MAAQGQGAAYLPEAEAPVQAGQLPLHTAVLPARGQPALSGEEPAASPSPSCTQLLHHHVAEVPGGRSPTAVVPKADFPERAQRSRGAEDTHTLSADGVMHEAPRGHGSRAVNPMGPLSYRTQVPGCPEPRPWSTSQPVPLSLLRSIWRGLSAVTHLS